MATVFDKILDTTTGPKSYDWYRKKVAAMTTPGARSLISKGKATLRPKYGIMNLFGYDPKHKEKLPYYDTFPLVLPLETYSDGFLGLNLHYLPIPLRIKLLDRLVDYSNNTQFDESTRLVVDYSRLKKIRLIKPTIHKYLAGQVQSQFRRIDADEFTIATLLPVQRFKKATAKEVWSDSRSMV